MALVGIEASLLVAGLAVVALGIQAKDSLVAPMLEIIPLPDGDYMAEGWMDEEIFLKALREFMLKKEGFNESETNVFIANAAVTKAHRAVVDIFGEYYFLPTSASDPGAIPATIARIM